MTVTTYVVYSVALLLVATAGWSIRPARPRRRVDIALFALTIALYLVYYDDEIRQLVPGFELWSWAGPLVDRYLGADRFDPNFHSDWTPAILVGVLLVWHFVIHALGRSRNAFLGDKTVVAAIASSVLVIGMIVSAFHLGWAGAAGLTLLAALAAWVKRLFTRRRGLSATRPAAVKTVVAPTGSGRRRPASNAIFVSYRRSDAPHAAHRLYEYLLERFGRRSAFIDIDDIEPGRDFVTALADAVDRCQVVLAVIGPTWLDPRLKNPNDFVRLEIESALQSGALVVPVLVDNTPMPGAEQLPPSLAPLTRRQAFELRLVSFRADCTELGDHLAATFV